ncbi:hypothetical protein VTK26DRAFT_5422 [Humicola hyalothermophila]
MAPASFNLGSFQTDKSVLEESRLVRRGGWLHPSVMKRARLTWNFALTPRGEVSVLVWIAGIPSSFSKMQLMPRGFGAPWSHCGPAVLLTQPRKAPNRLQSLVTRNRGASNRVAGHTNERIFCAALYHSVPCRSRSVCGGSCIVGSECTVFRIISSEAKSNPPATPGTVPLPLPRRSHWSWWAFGNWQPRAVSTRPSVHAIQTILSQGYHGAVA